MKLYLIRSAETREEHTHDYRKCEGQETLLWITWHVISTGTRRLHPRHVQRATVYGLDGLTSFSFSLSFLSSFFFPAPFLSPSLSVRTTHVQAIRYDWPDPRFRTNHFIKAVLNKPAFDYTPRHLVVIVSYTSSFLRTLLSGRSAWTEKNYLRHLSFPSIPRNSPDIFFVFVTKVSQRGVFSVNRNRYKKSKDTKIHRWQSLKRFNTHSKSFDCH